MMQGNSTDPKLPIFVKNIAKAKFESDTGSWDAQGRYILYINLFL